jgi:pyruvate dehydrogenase E2 component (dihydrolipoamide acetyltransferase)
MATQVAMPKLGLLMTEGVVVKWLVADGQPIEQGKPIVNIMTKKITYQVAAPTGGILHHAARVNEKVMIGEPLAFITAPGEPVPALPQKAPVAQSEAPGTSVRVAPSIGSTPARFVLASPWARHLAHELDVELVGLKGTGPDGCVVGRDVLRFNEERNKAMAKEQLKFPTPAEASTTARIVPFTGMRRVIAERMTESLHTMAQATLNAEVDVTEMLRVRKQAFPQSAPTHADVIIKAAAMALKTHPQLNAILLGDEIELIQDIHIGIAVQLEDGLLVPVIRNADRRTVAEIAQETRRLTKAARTGTLTVDDATGSTFTVTDLGVHGIDSFVPIINPPEAAILGIGRIVKKPVVFRGKIATRFMMMLCLAFDHRVVDGAPAAAFLRMVSRLLTKPQGLFT